MRRRYETVVGTDGGVVDGSSSPLEAEQHEQQATSNDEPRQSQVDHFENLQSTNWQTVRWKPPPPRVSPNDPHVGWRTEFRSLEVQLVGYK